MAVLAGITNVANDAEDVLLPAPDERKTLFEDFERLVRARGWTWLVTSPLLLATPEYFPDRWSGGEPSLRRLVRRLARYAGIDEHQLHAQVHPVDPSTGSPKMQAPSPRDSGVWFEPATRTVHAEGTVMQTPEVVVPAAARAIAHAWLDHHGLTPKDETDRGRLIDVAGVYLGFGVLTTGFAQKQIAKSAGGFRADRKQVRVGVIGPRNLAYVLAIYAACRGLGPKGRKQIARQLPPNPGAFFKAAASFIDDFEPPVVERFGIPERDAWPPLRDFSVLTAPLDDTPEDSAVLQREAADEAEQAKKLEDQGVADMNMGKPVFRVDQRWGKKLARFFGMAVFLGGGFVVRSMPDAGINMTHLGIGAIGLAGLGYLIGMAFRDVRCSEPKCGAPLTPEMTTCPRCGGTISGTIKHPKERLAAEENLATKGGVSDVDSAAPPSTAA